jgi:hypothetical protein
MAHYLNARALKVFVGNCIARTFKTCNKGKGGRTQRADEKGVSGHASAIP